MKWKTRLCAVVCTAALCVSASAFTDTTGHWAEKAIDRWSKDKVITGFEDDTFRPEQPITRAQMATMLHKIFGWTERAENRFSDLSDTAWYADAILRANAAGVILGGDGKVRPEATITRQEAAVMLYRAFCMESEVSDKAFTDQADIAAWAAEAVTAMSARGYINGMGDGRFAPNGQLTRAQAATILNNIVSGFYDWAGAYSAGLSGVAVVRAPGVTLQNVSVDDILVTPAGAGSETTLSNCTVNGRLIVQCGDRFTVTELVGNTTVARLEITGENGRVTLGSKAQVGSIRISGKNASVSGLPIGTAVVVEAEGVVVNGHAAAVGTVTAEKDISTNGPTIDIVVGGA